MNLRITASHYNQTIDGQPVEIGEPAVLGKMSIFDSRKRRELFQQINSSRPNAKSLYFILSKGNIFNSSIGLQETIIITCVIHEENESVTVKGIQDQPSMNYSNQLATHLEGLFDDKKFSDVTFDVGGREFRVYKGILASRSQVFAAMFEYSTKENKTNNNFYHD